jgi:pyruvate/2-oxoacid:ferredoxin oxidoreductase alpha subunit
MKKLMTGNEAAAMAAMLAAPQVVAAYPITPQTSIAEKLAEYTAQGELKARYIKVESETSAMAACIGGSLSGARCFTATSSQGIALMHELLYWAAGARLPIVLVNVNRSMASPWSLGVDHNDTLSQRDTGCLQIYCETAQEVLDSILMAFRLSEEVLLPVIVAMDGFLLSHYTESVDVPQKEDIARFLPPRKADYKMDPHNPCTFGGGVSAQILYELRRIMQADMERAVESFRGVCDAFEGIFGRSYAPVEVYNPHQAPLGIITTGTLCGTVRSFIKNKDGASGAGLLKIRLFRPFPKKDVREALQGFERAVVIDRNLSPGSGGIFAEEIKGALYADERRIPVYSAIGGLGGVDVTPDTLGSLTEKVADPGLDKNATIWMEG